MDCDTPPPAPAPSVLADMCARRSWDNDTDDTSRQLLEWAADMIRAMVIEQTRAMSRAEQLEATAETLTLVIKAMEGKP